MITFLWKFLWTKRRLEALRNCFHTLFQSSESNGEPCWQVVKGTFVQLDDEKDLKKQIVQIYCFSCDFPTSKENFFKAWKRDREKTSVERFNLQLVHIKNTKISFFTFSFLPANCTIHIANLCSLVCRPLFVSIEKCLKDKRFLRFLPTACTSFRLSLALFAPVDLHKFPFLHCSWNFSSNKMKRAE